MKILKVPPISWIERNPVKVIRSRSHDTSSRLQKEISPIPKTGVSDSLELPMSPTNPTKSSDCPKTSGLQPQNPTDQPPAIPSQVGVRSDQGGQDHPYAQPFVSQKLMNLAFYGIASGEPGGVHFYHLNKSTRRIENRAKGFNTGWWLGLTVMLFKLVFFMVQLFICFKTSSKLDLSKVLLLFGIAVVLQPLLYHIQNYIYADESIAFMNRFFRFSEDYCQYFRPSIRATKSKELQTAEVLLPTIYVSLCLLVVLIMSMSLARPDLKAFVSSTSSGKRGLAYEISLRILSEAITLYACYTAVTVTYFYGVGLSALLLLLACIKYLDLIRKGKKRYSPTTLLSLYQQIQILFDELNDLCSTALFPLLENVLIAFSVFGIYGLLRWTGIMRMTLLISGCFGLGTAFITFWTLAQINSASTSILVEWKRDFMFDTRDLRKLRPLRIKLGSYAFVDAGILLTMAEVIVNYTITILLMT